MRRVRGHMAWTIVVVWSVVAGLLAPAVAQESHVPAGHAQVIASGVDLIPKVDVAWRVTSSTAAPGDEAAFFNRTLGFVVATGDPILVTDGGNGNSTLVDAGQAVFQPEGASQRRSSVSEEESPFLGIDLIIAEDVDAEETLGESELVFAGEGFEAPDGNRDIRLTRDVLAPAEKGSFVATSDAPYLFYVVTGAIQVDDGNDHVTELREGQAAEFTGDISILAGANLGGTWLVASIGEEVDVPDIKATGDVTGNLEMRLEVCPDGFDEDCERDDDHEVTPLAFHQVGSDNWIIPDRAETSNGDTVLTYRDLAVGDYTTAPEDDPQPDTRVKGATWNDDDEGWEFSIEADETTVLRVQLDTSVEETGALRITLYDCGEELGVQQNDSGCKLASEPWPVWVAPPDAGLDDFLWLDEDAEPLQNGAYLFENLQAGTWQLSPDEDGPSGPIEVTVEGDAYEIPDLWAVDIEPGETAEVLLARTVPEGAGNEGGSFNLVLLDCPSGTDVTEDTSACGPTSEPWNVSVELVGQSDSTTWTLFDDAVAGGNGEYLFSGLPATTLVFWPNPDGDEVWVDGDPYPVPDDLWMVDIPANGMAEAILYRVLAGGQPPMKGEGSLVIMQVDCPYGTDITVNAHPCQLSTEPWEVKITNLATGQTWSMFEDGWEYDSGTWVIERLPEGVYEVTVYANNNWDIWYLGISADNEVEITSLDETYVTIYSISRIP